MAEVAGHGAKIISVIKEKKSILTLPSIGLGFKNCDLSSCLTGILFACLTLFHLHLKLNTCFYVQIKLEN